MIDSSREDLYIKRDVDLGEFLSNKCILSEPA